MLSIDDSLLRQQIRRTPADAEARFALAQHYFQMRKWNPLHEIVKESATIDEIPSAERGRIVMLEVIAYYLRDKLDESPKYFSLTTHLNDAVTLDRVRFGNMHIFLIYWLRLMHYRKAKQHLYQNDAGRTLYFVGDSHSLGVHGMVIGAAKCQSRLVMGCKAFHVSEQSNNATYDYLMRSLQSLPPQSDVVMVLGEIDCRVEGGIVPYALKSGEDVKRVAERTAREYVERLSGFRHNMSFMTVPPLSPQRVLNAASQDEDYRVRTMLVRDAIEVFNDSLHTTCKERGHVVVDVYREAVSSNRLARADGHIDTIHLKPHVIKQAIDNADK